MSRTRGTFDLFAVLDCPQVEALTALDKLVLIYMALRRGTHRTAWPSLKTIQTDLHIDRRTCLRSIARLTAVGCIAKISGGGRTHPNHYEILTPEREANGLPLPGDKGRQNGSAKGGENAHKGRRAASRSRRKVKLNFSAQQTSAFIYDWATYTFTGLPPDLMEQWTNAYPLIDVDSELRKAAAWCRTNERKARERTDWPRFLGNWLARAQREAPEPWDDPDEAAFDAFVPAVRKAEGTP